MSKSLRTTSLLLLIFICAVLLSGLNRPIWIDETAEFALGAFGSTREAWEAFVRTAGSTNHGQTGSYYMLGHWLMRAFGASTFWLRLPANFLGVFLCLCTVHLLRVLKISFRWQVWAILAIFTQRWLADYFSEARTYIFLAACSVASFSYYMTPLEERSKPTVRLIGWLGISMGAISHPYFSLYWLFTCVLAYLYHLMLREGKAPRTFLEVTLNFLKSANLPLCIVGISIYFGIASQTWLAHKPPYFEGLDPFQWLPKNQPVAKHLYSQHILFLKYFKIPYSLLLLFSVFGIFKYDALWKNRKQLFAIYALFFGSLFISAALSYISYRNSYFVLERQMIASIALVTLTVPWFLSLVADMLPKNYSKLFTTAVFALIIGNSLVMAHEKWSNLVQWHKDAHTLPVVPSTITSKSTIEEVQDWAQLAQANVAEGGPVWPEFKKMF